MEQIIATEVVCQRFRIVDSLGNTAAIIDTDEDGGGRVVIFKDENIMVMIGGTDNGGAVSINKDNKPAVVVDTDTDSGRVIVVRDENEAIRLDADADGGHMTVRDRYGKLLVVINVDKEGNGSVATLGRDGDVGGVL